MTTAPDKLIALDFDGTLADLEGHVSPANLTALYRAQEAGAIIALSTGRPYVSIDPEAERLGLTEVPIIAFNGALIRRPGNGEVLHQEPLAAEPAAEIVEDCVARRLHLHYYLGDEMYVPRVSRLALLYCRRAGMGCTPVGDLRRFAGQSPLKLLVVDEPARIRELLEEYRERLGERVYVTPSMPEYLEFLSPRATKGLALAWLAEHFGIPLDRVMAAGDALNDLPLLQAAGHPVAMPEADAELRAVAEFIPTEQATGIAQAVEWFLGRV